MGPKSSLGQGGGGAAVAIQVGVSAWGGEIFLGLARIIEAGIKAVE